MSDADLSPDEVRHYAAVIEAAYNRHGNSGAYHETVMGVVGDGFDLARILPHLPPHVPPPIPPVLDQRYLGLSQIADC